MSNKLCRFALCVGVRDNTCFLVYDDDLSALEVRAEFSRARIGNWYRYEINECGEQNWEKVDDILPTKRVELTNGGKHNESVKICLPIFCVPNLTIFDCKLRKCKTVPTDEKLNIELYSPRLKSAIKVNANLVKQLSSSGIRETEHCHAFLTFNFVQSGNTVKPPQWSLNFMEDIQNPPTNVCSLHDDLANVFRSAIPPPLHRSATFGKPMEWGILKSVVIDPNNENIRLGSILCLRDGIIAFGRILPLKGQNWRAEEGDTVGFCSIDIVDLFEKPVRVAFNVLNWKHQHATSSDLLGDDCSLIAFDTDSKYHLASTVTVGSREGSEMGDSFWDVQSSSTKALVLYDQQHHDKQKQYDIKEAMREVGRNDSGDKRRFLPSQQQMNLQQHNQQMHLLEKDKQPIQDGVGVFTHTKGDVIFLRLFDKQSNCFTHLMAVTKNKVPFPPGNLNPTSIWWRISYRKQKTPRTVEILGICRETELHFVQPNLRNPQNWDLLFSEKIRDTKSERVEI
ncbi:hypothetical protein niasHT_037469 [Heterodera trifolii]|uniref:Uncharacterized protein n=1 Tax=Heterodera trifolii TaxID=157864 RepID=A0ABD2IP79_9BILA